MRIIYFGTPAFSADFLKSLLEDPYFEVVALVCQPDEPVGRKKILTAPPTKELFKRIHPDRPIFQPRKLKDEQLHHALKELAPDATVIVAYGRIIPEAILSLAPLGNVNVHPSLLPLWRGPSPMQAAIAHGDKKSGISIMLIDKEMDHGPILTQKVLPLEPQETLASFTQKVIEHGTPLLKEELKKLFQKTAHAQEQNHAHATYCKLLTKEDGVLHKEMRAEEIEAKIRAFSPWPGVRATFVLKNGESQEVKILHANVSNVKLPPGNICYEKDALLLGTQSTALHITQLQPATKTPMTATAYMVGYHATHLA